MLYGMLFLLGGISICMLEPNVSLKEALFECASAVGTVGLTLGITADLGEISRLILMVLMYLGRVGGLTMLYAMIHKIPVPSQLPQEKVNVG